MTAKDMFEELGYKQEKYELKTCNGKKDILRYKDSCCYKSISFQLNDKYFSTSCINEHYEKVLQAINKQCEELGWIDGR